jgi:hypothetical protein
MVSVGYVGAWITELRDDQPNHSFLVPISTLMATTANEIDLQPEVYPRSWNTMDDDIFMDLEAIVSGIRVRHQNNVYDGGVGDACISAGMGPWMKDNFHPSFQPSIDGIVRKRWQANQRSGLSCDELQSLRASGRDTFCGETHA